MTAKYYKQLIFYCKHFNTIVDKKNKLAEQDKFNQKIAYKGPTLAPPVINSILQADFKEKTNLSLWIVTLFLQKYLSPKKQ